MTSKAKGADISSNSELQEKIINFFEWNNVWLGMNSNRYYSLLDKANNNIYNTRFESSWAFQRLDESMTMIPINYDSLKTDNQYIYFLNH